MKQVLKQIGAVLAVLCISTGLMGCDDGTGVGNTQDPGQNINNSPVYITEICSKNQSAIADEDGEYSDYIELYNASSARVSLKNYYLSDSENKPTKWELPNIYIEAKSYLVIFASGKNRSQNGYYHTNFAISASLGETVTLVGSTGAIINKLAVTPCAVADISYGLVQEGEDAGKYMWFATATPGAQNTGTYAAEISSLKFDTVSLYINEFVIKNETIVYDAEGDYNDLIEIYNPGDAEVDLTGMYLSDDLNDPEKWQFPDGVKIGAKQYLLVQASGKNKQTDAEIHTSFRLSETDSGIILSDTRLHTIDAVEMLPLPANVSFGRMPDNIDSWKFFPQPTPGEANTTPSFEDLMAGFVEQAIGC